MQRRRVLASLGPALVAATAGCASAGTRSPTPAPYDVGMTASAFRPDRLAVAAGDTVVWRNTNSRAHTVTAYEDGIPAAAAYFASGGFDSEFAARDGYAAGLRGAIASGDTYSHTFTVPGEYRYFCVPHERGGMVGSVVVEG